MEPSQEMELIYLAARLLKAVWSEIDPEFKAKYRMDIWSQMESSVAACARMSSSLLKLLSSLCGRFQVATPGHNDEERAFVGACLRGEACDPDSLLKVLRDYPQVCVLELRIMNDAEKEVRSTIYAANR